MVYNKRSAHGFAKNFPVQFRDTVLDQVSSLVGKMDDFQLQSKLCGEEFQTRLLELYKSTSGNLPAVIHEDQSGIWLVPQDPSHRRILIISADLKTALGGLILMEVSRTVKVDLFE